MSYLKMALQALEFMEAATIERGDRDHTPPSKVVNLRPDDAPLTSPGERILTCADCGFHKYQGPNPRQGWGRCTFKGKGCYGLRPACEEGRQNIDGGQNDQPQD